MGLLWLAKADHLLRRIAKLRPHMVVELLNTEVVAKQEVDLLGTADFIQDNQDEKFAFQRTVSRLIEMQSDEYLQEGHRGGFKDDPKSDPINNK